MNDRTRDLFHEARRLTLAEQLDLARQLLDGASRGDSQDDPTAEWDAEAERRWREHEASNGPTYDALETIEDIRVRLARRRQQ